MCFFFFLSFFEGIIDKALKLIKQPHTNTHTPTQLKNHCFNQYLCLVFECEKQNCVG